MRFRFAATLRPTGHKFPQDCTFAAHASDEVIACFKRGLVVFVQQDHGQRFVNIRVHFFNESAGFGTDKMVCPRLDPKVEGAFGSAGLCPLTLATVIILFALVGSIGAARKQIFANVPRCLSIKVKTLA
jgi:hypothetical protein